MHNHKRIIFYVKLKSLLDKRVIHSFYLESFVTEAYKAKMREIAKQEEEEKLQDLKESIMDVTKQRDMSGFYK